MKKRLLSLLLALVMTVSLFSGLSMNALADDVIADWINDAEAIGTVVDTLFNEENIVYHGYCGDMSGDKPGRNVLFDIYEVTNPNELNDTYLKPLFGDAGFDPDQQYYGVWIYGSGDMNNYDHSHRRAPWSGTLTLKTGETVDMEERLIVAYIEGANAEHNYGTGVTTVGKDAFWGQDNLTAVFLGNTIQEIEARAFESCDMLKAINMPNSLTKILDRAFYACDRLTFLRAKATKITDIGDRAFFSCTFLADVELPYTIKTIGPYAFAWCRVLGTKNLILPNGLTTIGEGAFAFCTHFSKLTVPNSVTTIGPYAFLGAYELDELTFTPGTQTLTIGAGAFVANYDLTEVALNRVQSVGISAFGACEKLQRVVFDSTISRINERAFTSMMSDAYTGLAIIAEIRAIGDPSGDLDAFLQGTAKVTPLDHAAFSGDPPSYILAATEATRSFPDDCIVHYPEGNRKWLSQVTDSGTWKGYQTDYYWTGHFHEFEETTTKEASCEEAGNIHRACTVYGCGYEDDVPVAAPGHDYKAYKTFDPTCTEPGGTFEQCSRCGDLKQTATTDPLGHDERTCTVVPATCETPGSVTGNCVRCGEPINRVLPATGHTIPSATVLQEPTCTTPGLERGMCADCGKIVEQVIPTTDHTLVMQPPVAATCTTAGKTAGSYCSVCGTVVQKQETVPAFGHDYAETERVPATAATDGYV
ncbi:MAG: leucine-rich repeat domain-containing protein, partial [Clostridiales bacterium]|nr:leucine-rich repeat domain-containing protein [Clostridiales bacterium]